MLRFPAWRAELRAAASPQFLEACEAYELSCNAIAYWSSRERADRIEEYQKLAAVLEVEALLLALGVSIAS